MNPEAFTTIEQAATGRCHGSVLDVGAGTGLHSLVLQERGFAVTAIDIMPQAVEIMRRRGVSDARLGDFGFEGGPFDTLLMLGHGIGMVQTIRGLDRFLAHAHRLVTPGGQVLLDSLDVRRTSDPQHLAYQEANRRAGRYVGEIRIQFEFRGRAGPCCGWMHLDSETLKEHARKACWKCGVVHEADGGEYLASLSL